MRIGPEATKGEIVAASNALLGKTAADISEMIYERSDEVRAKSKGALAYLIEKDYFGIETNSAAAPDFTSEGIELKVTPLTPTGGDELLRPKERLVIGMVDYHDILEAEHWTEVPKLRKKLHDVLIIWYVHLDGDRSTYPVIWWDFWTPTPTQTAKIQEDYEEIRSRVQAGERLVTRTGDFLGTCPKHNSNFVKEEPSESEPGALVGSHPTREYEQRRGWQIKTAGVLDILEASTELDCESRGRATGIVREELWEKARERATDNLDEFRPHSSLDDFQE